MRLERTAESCPKVRLRAARCARNRFCLAAALLLVVPFAGPSVAQSPAYHLVEPWAQLPAGQQWQTMSAVDLDAHGRIYILQRGVPSTVMVFAPNGRLLRRWGEGLFPDAHGLRIDPDGNVWITDRKLHQVLKFSPTGEALLSIGTRGVSGDNSSRTALNGPSDVAFGKDGDVFVTDGESTNTRVLHYDRRGTLLTFWGSKGAGPGQFDVPHAIVTDSRGRLYVADRGNKRVQIFDQDGAVKGEITGVGTPFGLAMSEKDVLYVADGSKGAESLTVVDTRDGHVLDRFTESLDGAHMLAVDRNGAIYVAEARGKSVRKFVR